MGKIAFIFAGQGSQYPGMGKDFYENSECVKVLFQEAENRRPGTLRQMFEGSEEELRETVNTQPCLFLDDMAAALVLRENGIVPDAVAGFSLGEIAAVCIAGILGSEDAFELVCRRGALMQEAADGVKGSMVAVMRMEKDALQRLCDEYEVYPVNYNCPGQTVVSGEAERMEKFGEALAKAGVRFVPLAVGGAFHTPYMKPATDGLREALENNCRLNSPAVEIFANRTARPYGGTRDEIVATLSEQASNSVRWEETLQNMYAAGVDTFIECGPGKTLSSFVKKTLKNVTSLSVGNMEDLKNVVQQLRKMQNLQEA